MTAYKIADIGFGFDLSPDAESEYCGKFRISENELETLFDKHIFTVSTDMPRIGKAIFESGEYSLFETENGFARIITRFDNVSYKCFCVQSTFSPGGVIYFTEGGEKAKRTGAELFRIADTFSALLYYDAVILHGAAVEYDGRAYIFSGNSGVGKSTQAALWQKYNGAKVLNGDRVILRKKEGEWLAYGLPICGSSDICEVFSLPVGAVVFLSQDKVNMAKAAGSFEKLMLFVSQMNREAHAEEVNEKLLKLTGDICESIKTVSYRCTPEKEAAFYLKEYLGL